MKVIITRGNSSYGKASEIDVKEISGVHWDNWTGGYHKYAKEDFGNRHMYEISVEELQHFFSKLL